MPRLMTALCLLALLCLPARGADNPATGTWEWTYTTKDAKDPTKASVAKVSVKLVQEGEKLTGAFVERSGNDVPNADGKIDAAGNLSFSVTRELNGEKRLFKYHGKLD